MSRDAADAAARQNAGVRVAEGNARQQTPVSPACPDGFRMRLALGAIALLAIAVRLAPWHFVFDQGRTYFLDGDAYLHLRKILLHIAAFPRFVSFDWFEGYPRGTVALWTPVLDWLLALVSMIAGLGAPSTHTVEVIAALTPPVIGGLTVLPLYAFGRRVFDAPTALVGSTLLALMYGHVLFTVLGKPDNEMLEPLLALLLYAAYARLRDGSGGLRDASLCAGAAFGLLLFWRGGTLWVMLLWAAMLIDTTLDFLAGEEAGRPGHRASAGVFGLLALLVAPLCVLDLWGRQNSFSFNVISWFHVAVFGGAAAALYGYGRAAASWRRAGRKAAGFFIRVGLVTFGLVALGLFVPQLRENLVSGFGVLGIGRPDPWLESIEEYRPLFARGTEALLAGVPFAGWFYWLAPAALGLVVWRMRRTRRLDRTQVFFALFVVAVYAFSALRMRFIHMMAPAAALCGAYLLLLLYRRIARGASGPSIPGVAIAAGLGVALLWPALKNDYALTARPPGLVIKGPIEDAMLWLRDTTPAPAEAGAGRPAYGVMAMWDYAAWLAQVAQRPAIASLYGSEAAGLRESAEFFLAEGEAEAVSVLRRTGARYAVFSDFVGDLPVLARVLGRADTDYVEAVRSKDGSGTLYRTGPRYLRLLSTSLLLADGAGGQYAGMSFTPVGRMRLVYESREALNLSNFPLRVSGLKIFESVPGVRLRVLVAPGAQAQVTARVRTNLGREFTYALVAWGDAGGVAGFNLPYAAAVTTAAAGLATPYTVVSAGRSLALNVTEGQVLSGSLLGADLR